MQKRLFRKGLALLLAFLMLFETIPAFAFEQASDGKVIAETPDNGYTKNREEFPDHTGEISVTLFKDELYEGEHAVFCVFGSRKPESSYRWEFKSPDGEGWQVIEGAADLIYTIDPVSLESNGQYRCVATTEYDGNVISDPVTLHVYSDENNAGYSSFSESSYNPRDLYDEEDAVIITTAEELQNMGDSGYYKLGNDIDLSGIEWRPLEFRDGIFDGNNYTIRNLNMASYYEYDYYEYDFAGLFSHIYNAFIMEINVRVRLQA